MKSRKIQILTGLAACIALFLAWLFCLPGRMFERVPYSTVVLAKDGELLGARVADDGQWRFPPCDSVPYKFERALIEYEDRDFYGHCGVSMRSIGRAIVQNIANGRVVSGASTLTMQIMRMQRRRPRNLWQKLVETIMATRLEFRYNKTELLCMYASHAPFGGNVVGIGAATYRYLGNDGSDMSWAQAATLAVLQNAPAHIHLGHNRPKLLAKRNRLLHRLHQTNDISAEELALALEEPLIGEPHTMPAIATHLVEHYYRVAHGKRSQLHIDFNLQCRIEALAASRRSELAMSGANDLAIVVTELATGNTIAYCGNADMNTDRPGKWVDIARAPRSSGSILKPLLYCAALQEGIILPSTLLPDIPTDFGGFAPKNFDGGFAGAVHAGEALSLSLNVPNVHLLKVFGVSRFASLLKRAGLSSLWRSADTYGLSLILGGAEVTLYDVVHAYTDILRGHNPDFNDPVAIYAMLQAMENVSRPDWLDRSRAASVPGIAWKTGTSYGARDGWAIGMTTGYVVGVWTGNADGTPVPDLTGARMAGPVMFDVFNQLPAAPDFTQPQGLSATICAKSGHRAGTDCTETYTALVPAKAFKTAVCPYCKAIPVSLDGQRLVSDCSEPSVLQSYFILPPVQKYYYKKHNSGYADPPADGTAVNAMHFIYPANGTVVALPDSASLICKVAHSRADANIYWHIDDTYLGTTTDLHHMAIQPSTGLHRITVIDNSGNASTSEIIVR